VDARRASELEQRVVALIHMFDGRLPQATLDDLLMDATHNEWGIALENLCTHLFEYDVISEGMEIEEIKRLTADMNMSNKTWNFLAARPSA
jgi:hypothetical protein